MAELITGSRPIAGTAPDPAAQNAEVAARLAAQGRETASPKVEELITTGDALDELAKAKGGEAPPEPGAPVPPVVPEPGTQPEPTEAEKKAAEEALAKADEEKRAAVKKDEALKSRADEIFKDTPSLPTGAAPKSSEAFAAIKVKATQDILALEEQLNTLKKQLAEKEEKLKTPIPEEITKELQTHREWRAKMDVEFDPKFKEYDKKVAEAQEFIYDQLRQSPAVSEDTINQIKKYGGPQKVKISDLFDSIKDPVMQRVVEAKVADILQLDYQKRQAISAAKSNVGEYLAQRQKEFTETVHEHTNNTTAELNKFLPALEEFREKEVVGDDAAKKAATEHNQFYTKVRGEIQEALGDDSPRMRAILLTGYAKLCFLQRDNKALTETNKTLQKSVTELTGKLEKIQRATRSRLPESAAPTGGIPKPAETKSVNTDTGGALDAIAKQVMETRAAART